MNFEELLKLLENGNIDEAKKAVSSLKLKFDTNIAELKAMESRFNEAKEGRDKAKARLNELKGTLGLEELTSDNVKELIKKGKNDESLKQEIENLTKMISAKDEELKSKLAEADKRYTDKIVEVEIAKLGTNANVVNDKALSILIEAIKEGATLDNGIIIYKDADGSTIRNSTGQPLSISEKINQFKADDTYSFLFKPTTNGGSGMQNSSGAGNKAPNEYTEAERVQLYRQNPALFKELFAKP